VLGSPTATGEAHWAAAPIWCARCATFWVRGRRSRS
jgi:hypothetical protein